jgi:hypothetical protein
VDGGFITDGVFVEPGGHGAVAFEPVDAAFHCVALLVQDGVEGRRSSALPSLRAAIRILIGRAGLRLTADDLAELSGRPRDRSVATEQLG